jgi:hypothetical protein
MLQLSAESLHLIGLATRRPILDLIAPVNYEFAIIVPFALAYFAGKWIRGRIYAQIGAFMLGLWIGFVLHVLSVHASLYMPSFFRRTLWMCGGAALAGLWLRASRVQRVA